jgi:hypothetical protein
MLKMDGFNDCILGIVERCGQEPFIVYDTQKVIDALVADGMSREDAWEFHGFNQACAFMGEGTPGFLYPFEEDIDDK